MGEVTFVAAVVGDRLRNAPARRPAPSTSRPPARPLAGGWASPPAASQRGCGAILPAGEQGPPDGHAAQPVNRDDCARTARRTPNCPRSHAARSLPRGQFLGPHWAQLPDLRGSPSSWERQPRLGAGILAGHRLSCPWWQAGLWVRAGCADGADTAPHASWAWPVHRADLGEWVAGPGFEPGKAVFGGLRVGTVQVRAPR